MFDRTKKRLIHFCTTGNIAEDFARVRKKRIKLLRSVIHLCFYAQCAAAVGCVVTAVLADVGAALAGVAIGSFAVVAVAFMSLGGGSAEKTFSYLLDLVYAVICFLTGGKPFYICGALMLLAAVFALGEFFAAYFRQYLRDFSADMLTRSDYIMLSLFAEEKRSAPEVHTPPIPPAKSEMKLLSEQLGGILNGAVCAGSAADSQRRDADV